MNTLALPRRQELPEEAFITGPELAELQPRGFVSEHRLAIFAVSYAADSLLLNLCGCPEHPDPEGDHLVTVADAIVELQDKRRRGVWGYDQFPLDEFGVFWPYCSLLQPNPMSGWRTAAEQRAYDAALADLSLWYAHQMTTVFLLTTSAPAGTPGYMARGWQLFEACVARLLKTYRSDVWDPVVDVGDRLRSRLPPVSLEDFAAKLSVSHFALEADRPIVLKLYEHTLFTALGHAPALAFDKCGWRDHEMRLLTRALPLCTRLRSLTLMDNSYGADGLVDFCFVIAADAALPMLRDLNLSGNNIGNVALAEEAAHPLQILAWAVSPFKAADVAAAEERHELVSKVRPAGLPLLQTLTLDSCRIIPRTFLLFCRALMPNALANVVRLSVNANDLEQAGIDPLVEALDCGALPHLRTVMGVGGAGVLGAEVSSLRQAKLMRDKLSSIDWSKTNAVQKLGASERGFYGKDFQDINRIETRLQQAKLNLDRWRQRQRQAQSLTQ